MEWAVLIIGAVAAGWIDAVIGGGGLILIPLILATLPTLAPVTALATNKMAAVCGTASAAVALNRKVGFDARRAALYVPVALVASASGAGLASALNKDVMRPLVIVLLLAVGIFVACKPQFGESTGGKQWRVLALVAVAAVAFYDGIFGPGTGMFLIMAFTALLSNDFVRSAALAKVVNTATNVGALAVFIAAGNVWWTLGLVLAVANVCGAQLGARTVLKGGTKLLRIALLALVVVMCTYLGVQQWG